MHLSSSFIHHILLPPHQPPTDQPPGFAIHGLIGCAILFFRPLLAQVPLAVLMGLFLYLGKSSLAGNQMVRAWISLMEKTGPRPRPLVQCYVLSPAHTLIHVHFCVFVTFRDVTSQWERAKLLVTDPNMRPKAAWARKVPYKVRPCTASSH